MYPNHLLIVPAAKEGESFEMWTQQFVGIANRSTARLIGTYDGSELGFQYQLFVDKVQDLMGRPMTLAAITYVPYTIANIVVSCY